MKINDVRGYDHVDDFKICLQKLNDYFSVVNKIEIVHKEKKGNKIVDDEIIIT